MSESFRKGETVEIRFPQMDTNVGTWLASESPMTTPFKFSIPDHLSKFDANFWLGKESSPPESGRAGDLLSEWLCPSDNKLPNNSPDHRESVSAWIGDCRRSSSRANSASDDDEESIEVIQSAFSDIRLEDGLDQWLFL